MQVTIRVEDHGKWKQTHEILRLTEVEKISPAVVFWNAKQIEMQYRSAGAGGLILWENLFDTDRDWWLSVLQMEPFKEGVTMPQAMMEYLIHEVGIPCGATKEVKHFPKPKNYVDFEEDAVLSAGPRMEDAKQLGEQSAKRPDVGDAEAVPGGGALRRERERVQPTRLGVLRRGEVGAGGALRVAHGARCAHGDPV